jgi:hypothetical protein
MKTAMFGSVLDREDVQRRHPGEKHACFTQFRKEAVREYITESPTGISIVCPVGASVARDGTVNFRAENS